MEAKFNDIKVGDKVMLRSSGGWYSNTKYKEVTVSKVNKSTFSIGGGTTLYRKDNGERYGERYAPTRIEPLDMEKIKKSQEEEDRQNRTSHAHHSISGTTMRNLSLDKLKRIVAIINEEETPIEENQ